VLRAHSSAHPYLPKRIAPQSQELSQPVPTNWHTCSCLGTSFFRVYSAYDFCRIGTEPEAFPGHRGTHPRWRFPLGQQHRRRLYVSFKREVILPLKRCMSLRGPLLCHTTSSKGWPHDYDLRPKPAQRIRMRTVHRQYLCSHCAPAPALWGMFSCIGTSPCPYRVQEAHQESTHVIDGLSNPPTT